MEFELFFTFTCECTLNYKKMLLLGFNVLIISSADEIALEMRFKMISRTYHQFDLDLKKVSLDLPQIA